MASGADLDISRRLSKYCLVADPVSQGVLPTKGRKPNLNAPRFGCRTVWDMSLFKRQPGHSGALPKVPGPGPVLPPHDRVYGHTKSGTPITDETIEQFVDEAERGYDTGQLADRPRGVGRPPTQT
jgi:hypothetical protein